MKRETIKGVAKYIPLASPSFDHKKYAESKKQSKSSTNVQQERSLSMDTDSGALSRRLQEASWQKMDRSMSMDDSVQPVSGSSPYPEYQALRSRQVSPCPSLNDLNDSYNNEPSASDYELAAGNCEFADGDCGWFAGRNFYFVSEMEPLAIEEPSQRIVAV